MVKNRVIAALALGVLGLPLAAPGIVHSVNILDYTYEPDTTNVNAGDSVVWHNTSAYYPHTTTSGTSGVPDGLWDSGTLNPGQSYARMFTEAGSREQRCA